MARSGQLKGKVGDTELKGLLEQVRDGLVLHRSAANHQSKSFLGICTVTTSGFRINGTSRVTYEGSRSWYHGTRGILLIAVILSDSLCLLSYNRFNGRGTNQSLTNTICRLACIHMYDGHEHIVP
jgi:hypothetical protein